MEIIATKFLPLRYKGIFFTLKERTHGLQNTQAMSGKFEPNSTNTPTKVIGQYRKVQILKDLNSKHTCYQMIS